VRREPPANRLNVEIPWIVGVVGMAVVTFFYERLVQLVRDHIYLADVIIA
jgi:hypothetical protein